MQIDHIPDSEEAFPKQPVGADALLKDVVERFFDIRDCQDRIVALQEELCNHPNCDRDRNSLDRVD